MEAALPKSSRDPKPGRSPLRARLLILLALLALSVVLVIVVTKPQRIHLSAETSVEFLGVTVGTNAFIHGNLLEKILGDRIPAKGLTLGPFNLRRPRTYTVNTDDAPLAARILIRGPLEQLEQWFTRDLTVIAANSAGRELENPPPVPFSTFPGASNEMLLTVPLFAFPRDERNVRLRLTLLRRRSAERRSLQFKFPNPFPRPPPAQWQPATLPITNVAADAQFILQQFSDPTRLTFLLPKGWRPTECKIEDSEGNFHRARLPEAYISDSQTGSALIAAARADQQMPDGYVTSTKTVVPFRHSLERDRVWKITATFVAASINAIPAGPRYDVARIDSGHDLRFQIPVNTKLTLTNSAGATYTCTFYGDTLSIMNATNNTEKTHFVILSATDDLHRDVNFTFGPENFRRPGFAVPAGGQTWRIAGTPNFPIRVQPYTTTNLSLYLVVPKTVETVFYIHPTP